MATKVLICDDSNFARKQMARSLPDGWEVDITFAGNGEEALQAIKAGQGEVVFLDLTMPVMDGFETLENIKVNDMNALVIVVSGDIQPEARQRVKNLGAIDFIKKPINKAKAELILKEYGIL